MPPLLALFRRLLSPLRPAVHALRYRARLRETRKCLEELKRITSEQQLDLALMERIRTAWGNTGWSADAGFLVEVGKRVWRHPGPVLDCGSGVSTLVLAVLAARHGATVWSLEQDRTWYEEMRRQLTALHLHNVVLWHAPLRSNGDYLWFDLTSRELPPHFPTVSCDGPAVRRSAGTPEEFAAWRSGVVSMLRDREVTFDEIVLDDFEDSRCAALIERWNRAGITTSVVASPAGTLVVGRPTETPSPRSILMDPP